MLVEEMIRYLSKELDDRVTPVEVREAAQDANLLSGGGDGTAELIPDRERTLTAGDGDVASTPWSGMAVATADAQTDSPVEVLERHAPLSWNSLQKREVVEAL